MRRGLDNGLRRVTEWGIQRLATAPLGTGAGHLEPDDVASIMIPLLVERTIARKACVECHLIGDFLNLYREQDGTLDKLVHLYRSPDIRTLGIELDVPKGLVVKEVRDTVEDAGMKPGDRITAPRVTQGGQQIQRHAISNSGQPVRPDCARHRRESSPHFPPRWCRPRQSLR